MYRLALLRVRKRNDHVTKAIAVDRQPAGSDGHSPCLSAMTRWIYLGVAPSLRKVVDACEQGSAGADDQQSPRGATWLDLDGASSTRSKQSAPASSETTADSHGKAGTSEDAFARHDTLVTSEVAVGTSRSGNGSQTHLSAEIRDALLEKSLRALEASQRIDIRRRHLSTEAGGEQDQADDSTDAHSFQEDGLETHFSVEEDSYLPPPTQRGPGNRSTTRARTSFGNQTTTTTYEQSIVNLPSWSFSLASITPLSHIMRGKTNAKKVNLLVVVHEIEGPETIPLKKPSLNKTGRMQAVRRATLLVLDESALTMSIVLWDDYADKWAGEYLRAGDVVYLQGIAMSEYKGQKQGSAVQGSKVQICYRTLLLPPLGRSGDAVSSSASSLDNNEEEMEEQNAMFRPDLDLAWDLVSQKVKGLVRCARA